MFCPNAADWGNVADWASGIGSFAAVAAALWIAGGERRRADRQRSIDENVEYERRAKVIGEVIRLSCEIETQALSYPMQTAMGGEDAKQRIELILDDIAGIRSQLSSLQNYPISDPQVFAEIGRIAHESRVEYDLGDRPLPYQLFTMHRLTEKMSIRRSAVTQLLSRQPPPPYDVIPAS
jgi:hypothetical protein